jgi:two-component system, LytTR family, response regulator
MTARCRVLVVDDEAPARRLACSLLTRMDDVEVIGDAASGQAAVAAIRHLRPDIVLLDVQMPGLDGFDIIGAVGAANMPVVVFVTAYERYAIKAFDANAADYLVKPFDDERFRTAIERAVTRVRGGRSPELSARLEALLEQLARGRSPGQIALKTDGRHLLIDSGDIEYVEVSDKVLLVHTAEQVYQVRETLNGIERRLHGPPFVRIHRSVIVNIGRVKEIQPWFQGDYVLILHNGKRLISGRGYRDVVRRLLARSAG